MFFDRKYLYSALGYAVLGMLVGIAMAASKNHGQHVTHAHILLVGFVLSFSYALLHKLWLGPVKPGLAWSQFLLHQLGALMMVIGLSLLYGGLVPEPVIGPVLGLASVALLLALLLMLVMLVRSSTAKN